jgi:GNAT superfamily N-acetyltransferase
MLDDVGSAATPSAAHTAAAPEVLTLRDGARVTVREVTREDEGALLAFLAGLGAEARRLRFFTGAADLAGAARAASACGERGFGIVAHDELGALVAHALWARLDDTRAEVALAVADHLHDRGLGTLLLERLAANAEREGVQHFVADVLPENRLMLDVFRDGFDAHVSLRGGIDKVELPTSAWRTAQHRFPKPGGLEPEP